MNKFEKAFGESKTDKYVHHYYDFYNEVVGDEHIESVLEIGVLKGSSLRAWQSIWPSATVEGIECSEYYINMVKNEFTVYQANSIIEVPTNIKPSYDLIVDDGHHHWFYQSGTFDNYFNLAKKFYVIEDVLGDYGYEKLKGLIPSDIFNEARVFISKGPKRSFRHSSYKEDKASYKFLVFDKR